MQCFKQKSIVIRQSQNYIAASGLSTVNTKLSYHKQISINGTGKKESPNDKYKYASHLCLVLVSLTDIFSHQLRVACYYIPTGIELADDT